MDEPADRQRIRRRYETGVMITYSPNDHQKLLYAVGLFEESFDRLVAEGYIEEVDDLFRLTEKGSNAASKMMDRIIRGVNRLSSGLHASFISIIVNVVLAAVSVTAGVLSNSMGLLSSGVENTVSIFTSAAAYLGIRYRMDAIANFAIIVVIVAVGLVLGYGSLDRLARPQPVDSGIMPISVAIFTGIACYGLSVYQRFFGKRSGKFSLIILSVDNVNSVLVSVAVLVGIMFARLDVTFVDSLVSLGVSLLMLKSAFDLGVEAVSAARGKEPDMSRYELKGERRVVARRKDRFRLWTLYLLREPKTRDELEEMFSLSNIRGLQYAASALRLDLDYSRHCGLILSEFMDGGLVVEKGGKYCLTSDGEIALSAALAGSGVRVPGAADLKSGKSHYM